jgi:HK97 family phage major capsid protein
MGRPVIPVEYCNTLGTAGDIVLCDLSQYLTVDKGAMETASSIHVRFIYDEMTFRFVMRFAGQSAWNAPLTPFKGTNTQSPFITLQSR